MFLFIAEAFGPITSWEIDGETVETVSDYILGVSKITADGDFSHEKDLIWVSSNEVDEPKAYHTEWSKSEREE